jgi:hypothetical protein
LTDALKTRVLREVPMKIRFGYELAYLSPQATPMIVLLSAQPNATQRLLISDQLQTAPPVPLKQYDGLHKVRAAAIIRTTEISRSPTRRGQRFCTSQAAEPPKALLRS